MHKDDDLVCGFEPLLPRVTRVAANSDYKLFLTFDNGENRVFDAKPLLEFPAFKSLCNIGRFKTVKIEFGTVVWGDIDYCPDTLYIESVPEECNAELEKASLSSMGFWDNSVDNEVWNSAHKALN